MTTITSTQTSIHGVFVGVFATGVLILGKPTQGKSELALDLIYRGHRLIADDIVTITLNNQQLFGTCPSLTQDFLTVHNLGTMNIRKLFGNKAICLDKQIEISINLDFNQMNDTDTSLLRGSQTTRNILGIEVPEWAIQNNTHRHSSILVETIVKIYQQQQAGYHASDEIMQRQQLMINNV